VTNNLARRIFEHKEKIAKGFTRQYNVTKLVYYEVFEDPFNAIAGKSKSRLDPGRRRLN
jgi:putative endonuclease